MIYSGQPGQVIGIMLYSCNCCWHGQRCRLRHHARYRTTACIGVPHDMPAMGHLYGVNVLTVLPLGARCSCYDHACIPQGQMTRSRSVQISSSSWLTWWDIQASGAGTPKCSQHTACARVMGLPAGVHRDVRHSPRRGHYRLGQCCAVLHSKPHGLHAVRAAEECDASSGGAVRRQRQLSQPASHQR